MKKPDINNLPDHTEKLKKIKKIVIKTIDKFNDDKKKKKLTEIRKKVYKYIFETYLYEVADLSLSRNEIRDELYKYYISTYTESSTLGNKLFYDEYFSLHQPYDEVKKIIWKAIFKLDKDGIVEPNILI